jgi:hypothetical protein
MPAPLTTATEAVKWRINVDDLELLRLLFPGKVNTAARDILHAWCEHTRARVNGVAQDAAAVGRASGKVYGEPL